MTFRILINGVDVSANVLLDDLSIKRTMAPGVSTASVSLNVDQTLQPMYDFAFFDVAQYGMDLTHLDQVQILNAGTGTVVFAGLIVKVSYSSDAPDVVRWNLDCQDHSILLDTTIVNRAFTNTTDKAIIQTVLQTYLPGFVAADVDTLVPQVASYEAKDATVRKILQDICDLTNAQYFIDTGKQLHYHQGGSTAALFGLSDEPNGSTTVECDLTGFSRDYTGRANQVLFLGGSDAQTGVELRVTVNDTAHQAEYGHVYSVTVVDRNITDQTTATLRAQAELARRTRPAETGTCTVQRDGLDVGQLVTIENAAYQVFGQYLIRDVEIHPVTAELTEYSIQFGDYRPDLVGILAAIARRKETQPAKTVIPDGSVTNSKLAGGITGDKIEAVNVGSLVGNLDVSRVDNIGAINISSLTGTLDASRVANLGAISISTFAGNLDVSRVANLGTISISAFSGNLDASRVANLNQISISTFTGSLDVSKVANLNTVNITSFAGVVTTDKLAAGILNDLTKFSDDLRPITKVASLPALPSAAYPVNTVVLQLADSKLYKNVADAWTPVSASDNITGKISSGDILSVSGGTIIGPISAGCITHVQVSQFAGTLSASQCGALSIGGFTGNLDVSRVDNLGTLEISTFSGNLDVSRVANLGTLAISSFTGNLDVSRVSGLNTISINTFSGTIGTINANTVTLTGQWNDSHIGSVSVGKLTAGQVTVNSTSTYGLGVKNGLAAANVFPGTIMGYNTSGVSSWFINGSSGAAQATFAQANGIPGVVITASTGSVGCSNASNQQTILLTGSTGTVQAASFDYRGTTVATAGTLAGYLYFKVNGVQYKLPYYNN